MNFVRRPGHTQLPEIYTIRISMLITLRHARVVPVNVSRGVHATGRRGTRHSTRNLISGLSTFFCPLLSLSSLYLSISVLLVFADFDARECLCDTRANSESRPSRCGFRSSDSQALSVRYSFFFSLIFFILFFHSLFRRGNPRSRKGRWYIERWWR